MTASDHRPRAALRRRLRPRPLTPHTGTQPARAVPQRVV